MPGRLTLPMTSMMSSSAGFADAVVALYGDAARWERQARAGLDNIDRHFSPKAAEATVRRVFFD